MNNNWLIQNAMLINEGDIFLADIRVSEGRIKQICRLDQSQKMGEKLEERPGEKVLDATGRYLIPGMIDDQVHFREPGLTHKATIHSESRAAVAGGITSFMEMPNTLPNALTQELLEDKYKIAAKDSLANYSFFMGASNENIKEVLKTDPKNVCGLKVFMGSSTGNMLVDKKEVLSDIFRECRFLIAVHCEDEATIRRNMEIYRKKYGENVPISCHPEIRSAEACYKSSSTAVELAEKFDSRLHVLHISTAREISLFKNNIPLPDKKITAEACIHHLWFSDEDYAKKGTAIKWNPAVKTAKDRAAVLQGVLDNKIDVIATDHAPHTWEEKQNSYFNAPSGGPLVQHALPALFELYHQGKISLEKIVEKTSHAVADCFQIKDRGYLREGYWADLVLVDLDSEWQVNKENILYKCAWSPFEGQKFQSKISHTFINGSLAYETGKINEVNSARRLEFDR